MNDICFPTGWQADTRAKVTHDWLNDSCPDVTEKDSWPLVKSYHSNRSWLRSPTRLTPLLGTETAELFLVPMLA